MKLKKRIISIMLAAAMCITTVPLQYMPAYAAETSKKSGTCGKNLTWVLDDSGTLTISGTGEMRDGWRYGNTPRERYEIKAVVIEEGVTGINDYAFMECSEAKTVSIAKSVTRIGKYAFESCYRLIDITIPENVKTIGEHAFDTCTSLASVSMPESVTSIGDYAFNSCLCLSGIYIPEGVAYIGKCAFSNTVITDIALPSSVSEIGDAALASNSLNTITVSENNNNYCILDGILYNKDFSTLVKAPVTIESCTIPESVSVIDNYAFNKCAKLKSISIPENITSIGDYVFMDCASLTEIHIPESVKSIGDYAFYSCVKLSNISVPDNLTSIGNKVFYNTSYYNNPDNWDNGALYLGNYLLNTKDITGYYKIREGTTIIAACAFLLNEGMTGVFIPESVSVIGHSAFDNCKSLIEITIPDSVKVIEKNAFFHCTNLTSITIPNSVKLGKGAFFIGEYNKSNEAVLNITGGSYKTDMDLGVFPGYFKEINYKREALDYKIKDNTDGKVHYAETQKTHVDAIEHDTMYSRSSNPSFGLTCFGITSYNIFGENDRLQEARNPEGKLFAFYGDENVVTVVPKDSGGKQIQIENNGFTFGAATIGNDGCYYIVWGRSIQDNVIESSMDEENIQICKYNSSGNLIKTLGLPVSYTEAQFPFSSSNTNISYNKGFLCVMLGTRWITDLNGLHHQGSEFIGINAETMELAGFSNNVVSHEFGISMIPTDYGFAVIQRGDADVYNTRGISIGRYYISDNTLTTTNVMGDLRKIRDEILLYHSSGQYGDNEYKSDGNYTYVHMGGLATSNSTYAIAGKSERTYTSDIYKAGKKEDSLTGIYDVFVRIADLSLINNNNPDFAGTTRVDEFTGKDADYNMVWLTECNEKERAGSVKIVKLPDGSYCVLWEKMVYDEMGFLNFDSLRYVILDECGNILRRETAVYGANLSCTSIQPIVEGNTLSWAVANKESKNVTWYSVDLDRQEEYDESRVAEYKDTDENNTGNDKNNNNTEDNNTNDNNNTDNNTGIEDNNAGQNGNTDKNNNAEENNNKEKNDSTGYTVKTTGTQIVTRGFIYNKISGSAKKVQFAGTTIKKGLTSLVIPSSVKISGKVYKVTSVADNALKDMGKLKKLEIGANIEHIGKGAFNGCKNLKRIVIKSKKLTLEKTGSNAFKGINSKAVIKVPKSRITSYKKIIYAKGAGKSVKVK